MLQPAVQLVLAHLCDVTASMFPYVFTKCINKVLKEIKLMDFKHVARDLCLMIEPIVIDK